MRGVDTDNTNEAMRDKVSESQGTVFIASQKLQAFGVLLERQGEDCDGYTELHGLGVVLREMGDGLLQVWRDLDPATLFPEQVKSKAGRRGVAKKDLED